MVRVGKVLDCDLAAIEQSLRGRNQPRVGEDDFDEGGLLLSLDRWLNYHQNSNIFLT